MTPATMTLLSRIALAASAAVLYAACAVDVPTTSSQQPTVAPENTGEVSAADSTITGASIVNIASRFDGYSYFWGHASVPSASGPAGSCHKLTSSGCPHCTHSGANGGDCSGLAAKSWQVTEVLPVYDHDAHGPYSASSFSGSWKYGDAVTTANIGPGDASSSSEHVVIVAGITRNAAGAVTGVSTHECEGCAYGCKANHRTVLLPNRSRRKGATQAADTHTEDPTGGAAGSSGGGGLTTCRLPSQCTGSAKFCCDADHDGIAHCTATSCTPKRADPTSTAVCQNDSTCPTGSPHCCDNDNDGVAHCSTNACRTKPNGSTKEQCNLASQCGGKYPNCCDFDRDGVAHCVTADQVCAVPNKCTTDADCGANSVDTHCCGGVCSGQACACDHDVHTVGAALSPTCSTCAATVCQHDGPCCVEKWDLPCTSEATTYCQ